MERNLKLSISVLCCLLIFNSCAAQSAPDRKAPRKQVVVVLDKSKSVTYDSKAAVIKTWLKRKFLDVYGEAKDVFQYSTIFINDQTRVFPAPVNFTARCLYPEPATRLEEMELTKWKAKKNKWLNKHVDSLYNQIMMPPNGKRTDIYSMFEAVQNVQKSNGPWEEITVLVFSDMVHTASGDFKQLTIENAYAKGRDACAKLVRQMRIAKGNTANLRFHIYTPDNMSNTHIVNLFWKGFFAEWGITESQYQFQS